MKYQFHRAAVVFYESRQPGLGADYLAEFESAMRRVCAAPQMFPLECAPGIRNAVMPRFPFNVLFREWHGGIQVLSVAHHRRRPSYWLS